MIELWHRRNGYLVRAVALQRAKVVRLRREADEKEAIVGLVGPAKARISFNLQHFA